MSHPKEDAYDTFIAPLMAEIIAVAKGHKINMFTTFVLDDDDDDGSGPLMCTTSLPENDPADERGAKLVDACREVVRPMGASFVAITISTARAGGES